MDETAYHNICDRLFAHIENALEDADIDFESNSSMIEVLLEDGNKVIINRQPAVREIWVAARSGGYHFAWRDGNWQNTRSDNTLFDVLATVVGVDIHNC